MWRGNQTRLHSVLLIDVFRLYQVTIKTVALLVCLLKKVEMQKCSTFSLINWNTIPYSDRQLMSKTKKIILIGLSNQFKQNIYSTFDY